MTRFTSYPSRLTAVLPAIDQFAKVGRRRFPAGPPIGLGDFVCTRLGLDVASRLEGVPRTPLLSRKTNASSPRPPHQRLRLTKQLTHGHEVPILRRQNGFNSLVSGTLVRYRVDRSALGADDSAGANCACFEYQPSPRERQFAQRGAKRLPTKFGMGHKDAFASCDRKSVTLERYWWGRKTSWQASCPFL